MYSFEDFSFLPDSKTDIRLIPELLHQTTNAEEIIYCKMVLDLVLENVLTVEQKGLIVDFYWEDKTKSQMARELGVVHSTIVKRMQVAEKTIKNYLDFSLKIYRKQRENS